MKKLAVAVALALSCNVSPAKEIALDDFSDTSLLNLNYYAKTVGTTNGTVLRLTPAYLNIMGSAFTISKVNVAKFSTSFTFKITNPIYGGADGLVFVIQPISNRIVGSMGGGMGYYGISPSIGVEFDTYYNEGVDPSSNHIGININSHSKSVVNVYPNFKAGAIWHVWIDYDGKQLEVRANTTGERPTNPLLSRTLDISNLFGGISEAYVGFTAASGGATENHDILSWMYRSRDQYVFEDNSTLKVPAEEGVLTNTNLTAELDETTHAGQLTLQSDGAFTYVPDNLHCTDNFTYRTYDGEQYSNPQTVNLLIKSAPDLVLSDLRHQNNTLSINVKNDGIIPSSNTHISFYQFDATEGGTLLGTAPVSALAPNQQDTVTFNADNLQEPLNVYAVIDAENQLDECNEINNSITLFSSETEGVIPASCEIYGMDDREQNNSQLFSLRVKSSFKEFEHNQLATCVGCDLETLTSHPQTRVLYTASSDNTAIGRPKGYLYRIDAKIGTFLPVGSTGFDDIEGLAFSADGILYGYAKGHGIIDIDPLSGKSTLIVPSTVKVEGFALDNENPNVFYGAVEKDLWRFERTAEEPLQTVCDNLPGEVESLRMLSKEVVLLGIHNREGLQVFNVENCELAKEARTSTFENKDIEGVTLVGSGCATLSRLLSLAHGLSSHFLHPFIVSLYDEGVVGYETELPFLLAGGKEITFLPFEKREILFTHPTDVAVPSDKSPGIIAGENGKFTWVFANEQGQMLEQPLYQIQITDTDEIEKLFRAVPNFKKLVIHSDGNAYYTIGRSVYHSAFDMADGIRKPDPNALKVEKNEIDWAEDVNGDGIEDVEFTYHDGSKQIFFMFGKVREVTE